jgi:hypothetical protein
MCSNVRVDGRAVVLGWLWTVLIASVIVPESVAAQEAAGTSGSSGTTTLPEIRVIATTPVAPPRNPPRAPTAAAAPAPARAPARAAAPTPAPASAPAPAAAAAAEAAPKAVPGAVELDKIPPTS